MANYTYFRVGLLPLHRALVERASALQKVSPGKMCEILIREALDARRVTAKQARDAVDEQGIPY